jgi:integrase
MSIIEATTLRGLKSNGKTQWIRETGAGAVKGFCLKVTPSGQFTWYLAYTAPTTGKRRYHNLGDYPKLTLANARLAAGEVRKQIREGVDPALERDKLVAEQSAERKRLAQEKAEADRAVTVNEILDHYLETVSHHTKTDAANIFTNQFCNVRKKIGKLTAVSVTDEQIEELIDIHVARGKYRTAGKSYAYMRAAFTRAKKHKQFMLKRWSNPFDSVDKPEDSGSIAGDRALSANEIGVLLPLLDSDRIDSGIAAIIKVLLLTGQRVEQTSRMQWAHIDLTEGVWDVPALETKVGKRTGVGHILPLTPMVIEVIAAQPKIDDTWIFPGAKQGQPYSLGGISAALGKALAKLEEDAAADSTIETIEKFTPRDLRRTCTTHWSRLGILSEVRNRIQDHAVGSDIEGKHYNRHDYITEKRAALEKWGQELKRITGEPVEGNVIILRAG